MKLNHHVYETLENWSMAVEELWLRWGLVCLLLVALWIEGALV